MAAQAFLLIASFLVVLFILARPLGSGLARLINNVPLPGTGSVEKGIWRVLGIDDREMNWRQYLIAILLLNIVGLIALFAMLMLQGILPLNPQHFPGLSWHLALNTAVSFVTNTNWQSYAGEVSMGYLVQMLGLTVQSFVSAATGMAVVVALIRGFKRKLANGIGNRRQQAQLQLIVQFQAGKVFAGIAPMFEPGFLPVNHLGWLAVLLGAFKQHGQLLVLRRQ